MERAMLMAFEKAFSDESVLHLRREGYGNLYSVLAGSYYRSGDIANAIRCGLKAISYDPRSVKTLAGFPFRKGTNTFGAADS
jgi:hypothetical protein